VPEVFEGKDWSEFNSLENGNMTSTNPSKCASSLNEKAQQQSWCWNLAGKEK
jgi:hypothetical protein